MALNPMMQQAQMMGLAGPTEAYNYGAEILKAAGFKNPDRFIHAPPAGPDGKPLPAPQQPNPLVQVETIKQQSAHALKDKELQAQAQTGQAEGQMKYQLEQQRMQNEIAAQNAQAQADMELANAKMQMDATLAREKAALDADTAKTLKLIEIAGNVLAAQVAPQQTANGEIDTEDDQQPQMGAVLEQLTQMVAHLAQASNAPRRIVRGPDGRAVGVETVQMGMQ